MELDEQAVRRVIHAVDPALTVNGFYRLEGGSTEVYRIGLAASNLGSLVLKIYPDEPQWAPAKEALVAGWLKDLAPPVPISLHVDESRTVIPLRYAVKTYLPGGSLRRWMAEPDIVLAYRQMGELLRRIHSVPMPAYGYVLGQGVDEPMATNASYMTAAFDDLFRWFRDSGGEPGLARRLQHSAEDKFSLLDVEMGAVLAHDDLHQGNVLAVRGSSGHLQLSGLIDFGNARAADRLFDLAKALFCSTHEDPRSYRPILEGYGPVDHPDTESALRLYTLFHRMSMWCWLTKIGVDAATEGGPGGLISDLQEMVR